MPAEQSLAFEVSTREFPVHWSFEFPKAHLTNPMLQGWLMEARVHWRAEEDNVLAVGGVMETRENFAQLRRLTDSFQSFHVSGRATKAVGSIWAQHNRRDALFINSIIKSIRVGVHGGIFFSFPDAISFSSLHMRVGEGVPGFTRYILKNAILPDWPDGYINSTNGERFTLFGFMKFSYGGQNLIISELDKAAGISSLVIPHSSAYNVERLVEAITSLLTFLTGNEVVLVATEVLTERGHLISREFRGFCAKGGRKTRLAPFPFFGFEDVHGTRVEYVHLLPEVFSCMLANFMKTNSEYRFHEVIRHIHSGRTISMDPEAGFIPLAVSLDALSKGFERVRGLNDPTILPFADFRPVGRAVRTAINQARLLLAPQNQFAAQLYLNKVDGLNRQGMKEGFRRFIKLSQLPVTALELETIDKRNTAVHEGVLSANRDELDIQSLVDHYYRMLNFVNKAALMQLGYFGPIKNFGEPDWPVTDMRHDALNPLPF